MHAGSKLIWEPLADGECRVRIEVKNKSTGPLSALGYAKTFRAVRSTNEWMKDLREGEKR